MPSDNEIVDALPAADQAVKGLLRAWAVQRNSFNLTPDEDLQDFNMIDPDGGGTTPSVTQNGLLYGHDADDSTTAHDGVTCLVSADAQRYKLETGLGVAFSVLDKDLTAPPVSPTLGDKYLIYGSPTGDWAGQSGKIAVYTARGWNFATSPIGFLVYVRDESSYYHRNNAGTWTLGTGTRTLGSNSVALSSAINFGKRLIVENQTTNAPPGSPATGDAYIIGPSPTGAWSGHTLNIAICEDGSTFTIYTPTNGWSAYDKALNATYNYTGTAWQSSAGVWVDFHETALTVSGSSSPQGSGNYTFSTASGPTQSLAATRDDVGLTFAARRTGQRLRFRYQAYITGNTANAIYTAALYRGAESTPLGFFPIILNANNVWGGDFEVFADAADTASTTYKISIHFPTGTTTAVIFARRLTCEGSA